MTETVTYRCSRPAWPTDLSQAPGVFWHLTVMFRDRTIDPASLWRELDDHRFRDLLVHMSIVGPYHAEFTFSAVDGQLVPDAIGYALEAMLVCARFVRDINEVDFEAVRRRAQGLDYRVLSASGWNIVNDGTVPISIFGAGGSVSAVPS